jgi:hypothetical protein
MAEFNEAAFPGLLSKITQQKATVHQSRQNAMAARLNELAMRSHTSALERHALAEKVRACDDEVSAALAELGKLEQAMAQRAGADGVQCSEAIDHDRAVRS